jgi:hypothetical protein
MNRAIVAGALLLLSACAVTPEQWVSQCVDDGGARSACEAYMAEQIRLSTPVMICREVGDETHCYPGS